jgi:DNA polymerase III alpha subunit (gram-positive type)
MQIEIKDQEIKTARYHLQITDAEFYHDYLKEDENNAPIKCQIKSKLEIKIGEETIVKEISNTVYINPEEPIYKEILLHSKHIILV